MSSVCGVPCWRCVCGVFCREHRLYQTLDEKELKLVEEETQRRIKCLLEGTCPLHLRKELYLSLAVNVC